MRVPGFVALLMLTTTVHGQTLEDVIQRNEELVKKMAIEARNAYTDRCNLMKTCKCLHNDCARNNSNFQCETWPGRPEYCKDCSDQTQGTMLGYKFSSSRTAPGVDAKTDQAVEEMCYASSLDTLWKANAQANPGMWWQYYGTSFGLMQMFPAKAVDPASGWCTEYDHRYRPWYVQAASGPKDVYILLDRSASMEEQASLSYTRMQAAKRAVTSVIKSLTTTEDYFGIVAFSNTYKGRDAPRAFKPKLEKVTDKSKADAAKWVEALDAGGGTNFSQGFDKLFEVMDSSEAQESTSRCNKVVLFLTDGEDQGLHDLAGTAEYAAARDALVDRITGQNRDRAFIMSYAFNADVEVPKMISCANKGVAERVTGVDNLISAMNKYYQFLASAVPSDDTIRGVGRVRWSTPYSDATTKKMMSSPSAPVFDTDSANGKTLLGVVATDVLMEEFQEYANYDEVLTQLIFHSNKCVPFKSTECALEAIRGPPGSPLRCGASCGEEKIQGSDRCSQTPNLRTSAGFVSSAWCAAPEAEVPETSLGCCNARTCPASGSGARAPTAPVTAAPAEGATAGGGEPGYTAPAPEEDSGSSTGMIVGIAIGAVVLLGAIGGGIYWKNQRGRKPLERNVTTSNPPTGEMSVRPPSTNPHIDPNSVPVARAYQGAHAGPPSTGYGGPPSGMAPPGGLHPAAGGYGAPASGAQVNPQAGYSTGYAGHR